MSSSALAQGDARFCGNYAATASEVAGAAIKKNPTCLDPSRGVHDSYQSHFDWCMKNAPSTVQGAEANIRRLASACTGSGTARPGAAAPSKASSGGQEPYGQKIGAWSFTQDTHSTGVLCRAKAPTQGGLAVIGRYGDRSYYLATPTYGLAKGTYEGASIIIGGMTEPTTMKSDGRETYIRVGEDEIKRIVQARGWQWRAVAGGRTVAGSVNLDSNAGAAVSRLRECTKANVGR